VQKTTRGVAT